MFNRTGLYQAMTLIRVARDAANKNIENGNSKERLMAKAKIELCNDLLVGLQELLKGTVSSLEELE